MNTRTKSSSATIRTVDQESKTINHKKTYNEQYSHYATDIITATQRIKEALASLENNKLKMDAYEETNKIFLVLKTQSDNCSALFAHAQEEIKKLDMLNQNDLKKVLSILAKHDLTFLILKNKYEDLINKFTLNYSALQKQQTLFNEIKNDLTKTDSLIDNKMHRKHLEKCDLETFEKLNQAVAFF